MAPVTRKSLTRKGSRPRKASEAKSQGPEEMAGKDLILKTWMLLHRTRDLIFNGEDRVLSEFGLTAEQYTVLAAIRYFDDPVRPTDIGRWVGHKVNTVSMIVDRMVKSGLVERLRDLPDRREVRLSITAKGEKVFKPATPAVWSYVQEIMSSLSDEDKRSLIKLMEKVRDRAVQHASPETDNRATGSYEASDISRLVKRVGK